jgi:ABC-type amino acid transport substrate-binding protein
MPQVSDVAFNLLRQDSAATALDAVLTGQAEAAIVDAPSVLTLSGGGRLKIVTYLTDEWYAAAVHLQSRELLTAVNQTLARLAESGEMVRLQEKWFGLANK